MLEKIKNKSVLIANKPIDLRFSINGLVNLLTDEKSIDPFDGSVYVFYNNKKDKVKCIFWDGNGFILIYKKLYSHKFKIITNNKSDLNKIKSEELIKIIDAGKNI
jgi:transposase